MFLREKLPAMLWAEEIAGTVAARPQVRGTVEVSARELRRMQDGLDAACRPTSTRPMDQEATV